MNCRPEESGCWYCMTDFNSPLGWWNCNEFDTVMHVECIEYEHNNFAPNPELDIILRELGYEFGD